MWSGILSPERLHPISSPNYGREKPRLSRLTAGFSVKPLMADPISNE